MEHSAGEVVKRVFSSLADSLLGARPVFIGWLILAGVAADCVVAGLLMQQTGLQVLAGVLDFLHLPSSAGNFARGVDAWAASTFAHEVGHMFASVVIVICWVVILTGRRSGNLPRTPSPATLWIMLFFLQSAGFSWPAGFLVVAAVASIAVVCIWRRNGYPMALLLLELVVVPVYPLLMTGPLFLDTERNDMKKRSQA
ncbi:hypothetical protein [Pseudoclavibacter sp. VKM Ac-2888]|uniref:hypothetical protein n=1 Tax=Pseudoclavibacter sp. VKM Ac-2888 TaxID=2783830 RepID=UPI00188C59CC|nr:hypothetical protein [Pseudoclavibacter sp. VKM Ac-2888]MBF4549328.1 hypothetical protein [Pseudoclavibacter sp. VKM Ac-2888]